MNAVVLALALALLIAAPAPAALRPVRRLSAVARPSAVRLSWRDRSRGETRYEVRRRGRRVRLPAGRTVWRDRKVTPGTRYRYTVRACRRRRCAKGRSVKVTTPRRRGHARLGEPGGQPGQPGGQPGGSAPGGDAFAGSPVIGGCPILPQDNPWNSDVSHASVDTSHDYIGSP